MEKVDIVILVLFIAAMGIMVLAGRKSKNKNKKR